MLPKTAYLTAISAWYGAFGMQSVVFAWLVTMVLREPAERSGHCTNDPVVARYVADTYCAYLQTALVCDAKPPGPNCWRA